MNRRTFVCSLAGGLLAAPLAVSQDAGKIYRIGWLREGVVPIPKSFWDAMQERGWAENRNVTVVPRYASARDQLPALAQELAEHKVDLVMTDGTSATRAAKTATKSIPILFAIGADPVEQGFVASLARPDANLTGFTFGAYSAKQLQVLKEALPSINSVAYPIGETNPGIVRAASALGLRLEGIPVRGPDEVESFFAAARSKGADAVLFPNLSWAGANEKRIAAEATRFRMPLIGTWRSFAAFGALLSYGPKSISYWPRLAAQADKIFRGAKVSDLPVEQPMDFALVVNLGTAKAIGVTIAPSVLQRADEKIVRWDRGARFARMRLADHWNCDGPT